MKWNFLSGLLLGAALSRAALLAPEALGGNSRYTLNFGPELTHARHHTAHNPSIELSQFNVASGNTASMLLASLDDASKGLTVAQTFAQTLHPSSQFRVDSHYHSKHSNVYHVHLVQQIDGLDVINGNLGIHVDLSTGEILSYSDSAWKGKELCKSIAYGNQDNQHVFGSVATESCVTSFDAPDADTIVDPRVALLSFLRIGNPSLSEHLIAPETFLDAVKVEHPVHSLKDDDQVSTLLHNVPGATAVVPARLSYVQDEQGELVLTWRFEYQSQLNWYAAHVQASAEAGAVAEDLDTVHVVDWVKDFAPSVDSFDRDAFVAKVAGDRDDAPVEAAKTHPSEPVPQPTSATYRVFPWGVNDPLEGDRETVVDPANKYASPLGWHQVTNAPSYRVHHKQEADWHNEMGWSSKLKEGAGVNFTDTRGNNVFANYNPTGGNTFELLERPNSPSLNFTYLLNWGCKATNCTGRRIEPASYVNVSTTELFYTCNQIHDLSYNYGFDEAAGNFQERNLGGKGRGNDAVVAMAQDGSGYNNANFATPPDGQRPRMRMYVWNGDLPWRDGSLEAGIVIHEYTHGISTRLTGGPMNSDCLGWGEAGGMGEGWGDWLGTLIRMHHKKVRDWTMGEWAAGRGIRKYPYSTNATHNPQSYKSVDRMWEVHAIGEVWAEILFVVMEKLIGEYGLHHTLFPPTPINDNSTLVDIAAHREFYNVSSITGKKYPSRGNTLMIQLVLDGMKLQPCRPNFLSARDAIVAADHALTGGENYCLLMSGFADRGLGPDAAVRGTTPWGGGVRIEDRTLPAKCLKHSPKKGKHA